MRQDVAQLLDLLPLWSIQRRLHCRRRGTIAERLAPLVRDHLRGNVGQSYDRDGKRRRGDEGPNTVRGEKQTLYRGLRRHNEREEIVVLPKALVNNRCGRTLHGRQEGFSVVKRRTGTKRNRIPSGCKRVPDIFVRSSRPSGNSLIYAIKA